MSFWAIQDIGTYGFAVRCLAGLARLYAQVGVGYGYASPEREPCAVSLLSWTIHREISLPSSTMNFGCVILSSNSCWASAGHTRVVFVMSIALHLEAVRTC